jgi:hypothetical protein
MDPFTLRAVERIVAVIVGCIAIYLGYRLFLKVPEQTNSAGKVTLPWDISVVLSRVGPGVFFALFGATVVGLSFAKPVQYNEQELATLTQPHLPNTGSIEQTSITRTLSGAGAGLAAGDTAARERDRAELRKEMAVLNTLPNYLKPDLPAQDRSLLERALPRIKFKLIQAVWTDAWGDQERFKAWSNSAAEPPPAGVEQAVDLFRYPNGGSKP